MHKLAFLFLSTLVAMLAACGGRTIISEEKAQTMGAFKMETPLISRDILFGNPDRAAVRFSPDGKHLSWLAPLDGVLNIYVAPADDLEASRPITEDKGRGIRSYFWSYTNDRIVYTQDKDGDENWRVYTVNIETKDVVDLTPLENVQARISEVSYKFPNEILISLNDRDARFHDIHRVNLETGERELVFENPDFRSVMTDEDYQVRFANRYNDDGSIEYYIRSGDDWKEFLTVPEEDTLNTGLAGFDKTGRLVYLFDSRGRDTTALRSINLDTMEESLIAEDDRADLSGILSHPTENTIEAVSFTYDRERWIYLDEKVEKEFEFLRRVESGDIIVASRTLDDKNWILAYLGDAGPVKYYRYDRERVLAEFLFTNRSDLEGLPLVPMEPVFINSRDGKTLVSYLTLPPHVLTDDAKNPSKPVPLVLDVHGGPWARDNWGYNSMHQWLANRGYAVLSVNFRGSTGFGKAFINAGNKEWGVKMQDDLTDAVQWAIDNGIADPDRVAIMGGSYGGYATLAGLTFTPELYACGVDIVGPSNLITLLESIPPYWTSGKQLFKTRVGDIDTEEGREFLRSRSPLTFVDRIQAPLLIGQGANDPRVKQAEADQIVEAMDEKNIPVTYALYPDEGHGFARPENRISFNAVTEAFLAEHLGGRYEPIGNALNGASLQIPHGAEGIPGLEQALNQQ